MKEQQTIRIPTDINDRIKKKAAKIGCSYNSLILVYIALGEKLHEHKEKINQVD